MDGLLEQVVKKKKNYKYYLNVFLIILATFAIPGTFILIGLMIQRAYLIYIAFFALLFCIYGAWFFITSLRVEYEYALLSSTLRIDKVISKRKRRSILKVDVKSFDDFFRYSDEEMSKRKFNKVYHVGAEEYSEENYVACFHSEAKGKCAVVFTPNEELVTAMQRYFGNELKKKMYFEKKK